MWQSSGVLYLRYIFRTLKRVYKPTVVISTKLLKMSSFCQNMACSYRERAGVDLSDIYVWRMTIVAVNFHQRWVFFADFSVNSRSISMKFCKHSFQLFRPVMMKPESKPIAESKIPAPKTSVCRQGSKLKPHFYIDLSCAYIVSK